MKRAFLIILLATGTNWVSVVTDWYSANMNYGSIVALMTVES